MEKNFTLYSAKAIACFSVICLHIDLPGKLGSIITNLARFAVPLFLIITGYYTVCSNKKEMSEKLNKRIKKISILTLVSFIFYIVFNILINILNGTLDNYISEIKSYEKTLKFLLFNWTSPLAGAPHLWYLFALLYVYFLVKIVNRFNLYKQSYVLSILIIIGIYIFEIINSYYELSTSQIYYRNAWLMGFAFFMIGHYIKANESKFVLSDKKLRICSIIFLISIITVFCLETKIMNQNNCLFISSILIDILIFIIAINKKNIRILCNIGKYDSGNIYIIHYAIIILINNYLLTNINIENNLKLLLPIFVFIMSLILSVGYRKIKDNYLSYYKLNKIV